MVQWQEQLSIGVLEIDIQHRLLFEKFDAFLMACQSGTETEGVNQLFWFLQAYAVTHFTDEEKVMLRVGFPDFQKHRGQHLEFAAEIGMLKERLAAEGPSVDLISTITSFISGWLVEHISRMDKEIGRFMATAGTGMKS